MSFIENEIVNNNLFYKRNHFNYPALSYSNYWLPINGIVSTPILLSMEDILQLPSKTILAVLECSGDKRNLFEPKVFGEQWEKGAISQGYWKGVPLRTLLELSGIREGSKEIVVEGYDFGERTDLNEVFTYARSLPKRRLSILIPLLPMNIITSQFRLNMVIH
ncbi:molybdopterin-dependent oxidoreductase [Gracilibacillus sp. JCM 18860]